MQNQIEKPTSNIVSLFGTKKTAAEDAKKASEHDEAPKEGFCDAMKKNFENQERMKKERLKANQSVLKSYRIKN
jgi:hypothetical protein